MALGTVLITGSSGLIGSEAVLAYDRFGYDVHGLDNNARRTFFGPDGDTGWNLERLLNGTRSFTPHDVDLREHAAVEQLVSVLQPKIVIHCAAQPAHEYARVHPVADFEVNVAATLNLVEVCRRNCPDTTFIFCSSSKVYGPINEIPFKECQTRYELIVEGFGSGLTQEGITEQFPIDQGEGRGIYGTGKAAADLLVQEYGLTYNMRTVCLRGNCMTGAAHSPAELHGFLAYLCRCVTEGRTYQIFGYKGKQVRDIIHAEDFVNAMVMISLTPPEPGTVYNLGGGRKNSISILEAARMFEELSGVRLRTRFSEEPRHGDHRVYISDTAKFRSHYPGWGIKWELEAICRELLDRFASRTAAVQTG